MSLLGKLTQRLTRPVVSAIEHGVQQALPLHRPAPARPVDRFDGPAQASLDRTHPAPHATPLTPNDLAVLPQNQHQDGHTNACGTTCLASLMSYYGQPTTHQQVDAEIRPFDLGTGAEAIAGYANGHGMRAQVKNGGSLEDLAKLVDQGVPPMAHIDPDGGSNLNSHWVVVTGYTRNAAGGIESLVLSDPAGREGAATGSHRTVSAAEFDAQWSNLKYGGVSVGESRELIAIVPRDGQVTSADGRSRPASSISLPASSLKDELRATPAHLVETLGTDLGLAAQELKDEVRKARNFFRHLF